MWIVYGVECFRNNYRIQNSCFASNLLFNRICHADLNFIEWIDSKNERKKWKWNSCVSQLHLVRFWFDLPYKWDKKSSSNPLYGNSFISFHPIPNIMWNEDVFINGITISISNEIKIDYKQTDNYILGQSI